jgi:hypothetical protein
LTVLTFGLNFHFLNWHCSPLVNVREDQSTAHALVLARGHHVAALVAFDHRLVTRCTTSVAFVDFGHRPGKIVFCGMKHGSASLLFNILRSESRYHKIVAGQSTEAVCCSGDNSGACRSNPHAYWAGIACLKSMQIVFLYLFLFLLAKLLFSAATSSSVLS